MNSLPLVLLVAAGAACRALADIPTPALTEDAAAGPDAATGAPDAGDPEARCDYLDDDGDGLVDEGYAYVEDARLRRTLDSGPFPGVWWMGRSAERVAVVWATGEGNGGDTVSAVMFDLAGEPVAPRATTQVDQPWTVARPWWVGTRLLMAATQRSYACDGPSACATYLWGIDDDGAVGVAPTLVATDTPDVVGAYADSGDYYAAFVPGSGQGEIALRSYDGAAQPGVDATLFATGTGESVVGLRAIPAGDEILWLYRSSQTGLTLRATDPQGAATAGPTSLSLDPLALADRGFDPAVLDGDRLLIAYEVDGGVSVAVWTTAGNPIGEPIGLAGMERLYAMSDGFGQVYLLAGRRDDDDVPRAFLWRLASDGRIVQSGTPLEIPDNHQYAALAGVPEGVLLTVAAYDPGDQPVTFTRFGCP